MKIHCPFCAQELEVKGTRHGRQICALTYRFSHCNHNIYLVATDLALKRKRALELVEQKFA